MRIISILAVFLFVSCGQSSTQNQQDRHAHPADALFSAYLDSLQLEQNPNSSANQMYVLIPSGDCGACMQECLQALYRWDGLTQNTVHIINASPRARKALETSFPIPPIPDEDNLMEKMRLPSLSIALFHVQDNHLKNHFYCYEGQKFVSKIDSLIEAQPSARLK